MNDVKPGEFVWRRCSNGRYPVMFIGTIKDSYTARSYYAVDEPSGRRKYHYIGRWDWNEHDITFTSLGLAPMSPLEQLAASEQFASDKAEFWFNVMLCAAAIALVVFAVFLGL